MRLVIFVRKGGSTMQQRAWFILDIFRLIRYFLCDGGIKWSGRIFGSSLPSTLTFIKCMERANSSISKNPSQSTSESFQIFDNTELGNFDLMSSDFAAEIVKM